MEETEERWPEWPCCPQCGQRRHAVCPTCHAAQDDAPLADYVYEPAPLEPTRPGAASCSGGCCERNGEEPAGDQPPCSSPESVGPPEILLRCTACAEAFAPVFDRTCRRCGHDFGDGLLLSSDDGVSAARPILVLLLLVATAAVVLGYCWYLFRH
jgi:hypothetical protein